MIKITQNDAWFMSEVLELKSELKERLRSTPVEGLELDVDDADFLRDLCGDRLQTHGFDENYKPTDEGFKLENLIDKLFVG